MKWLASTIAAVSCAVVAGCATLLTDAEIRSLTTCHDTSWSHISKALVLGGYVPSRRSDTELETEPKDDVQIHVFRLGPNSFRFEVQRHGKPVPYWESDRPALWQYQRDVCG